jgi:hypothetical protein
LSFFQEEKLTPATLDHFVAESVASKIHENMVAFEFFGAGKRASFGRFPAFFSRGKTDARDPGPFLGHFLTLFWTKIRDPFLDHFCHFFKRKN